MDSYAIRFDPVLRGQERPNWIDDTVLDDVLEHWNVKQGLIQGARNPLRIGW